MKFISALFKGRSEPSLVDLLQKELDVDTLFQENSNSLSEWRPRINLEESAQGYFIQADLPGVDQKNMSIELENNTLTLKGHRDNPNKESRDNSLKMECFYGSFFRQITFTVDVDPKSVTAKLKNGVLEISVPKQMLPLNSTIPIWVEN